VEGARLAGNFYVRQVRARILPVPNQAGPESRYLRIELPRAGALALAEVRRSAAARTSPAPASPAEQRQGDGAARAALAIDGATEGPDLAATLNEENPWWELDLGSERPVERIVLWFGTNRLDRLEGFRVAALDAQRKKVWEKTGNPAPKKEVVFDLIEPREVEFANASADFNQPKLDEALVATDSPRSARYRRRGERGWGVDGVLGRDHALLLALSTPATIERGATLRVTVLQQSENGSATLGKFRLSVASDPRASEHIDTPPGIREVLSISPDQRNPAQKEAIRDYFVRHIAPGLNTKRDQLTRLARERDELKPLTVPVTRELQGRERRPTRIQLRGNFLVTTDEVEPGVPAVWPSIPRGSPPNRLALAQWLVSDDNPLTARVIANRYWEQVFGHGIVRTSEEFGSQGDLPMNQPLLDWLATANSRNRTGI
jgi:hypothetical protein